MKKTTGYLGTIGSNSHRVASITGSQDQLVPFSSFGLGQALRRGEIDQAVLPVENSTDGDVSWALRLLKNLNNGYRIVGEAELNVEWKLVGFGRIDQAKRVVSHPQGLAQCSLYIGANGFSTMDADDTTMAVKMVAEQKEVSLAAICTERAAVSHNVPVITGKISDDEKNVTRFVILGREAKSPTGLDRTSILFETENKHGALRRVLDILDVNGVNMTFITSKPAGGKTSTYVFFVDVEGHAKDDRVAWALRLLQEPDPKTGEKIVSWLRVLGSYPQAQTTING